MTDWTATIGSRRRTGEILAWGAAGVAAMAVHAGAAALLLHAPESPPAGIPETYAIEIAPEFLAQESMSDIAPAPEMVESPDLPVAPEMPEETDLPEPEPDMPDLAELEPPPEPEPDRPVLREPDPEPPPPKMETIAEKPEVVLPEAAQEPPPRRREAARTTRTPPAPRTSAPARVEAPRAERAATPASARGITLEQAQRRWRDQVNTHVARYMRRWRNTARGSVDIQMVVAIDGGGRVRSVEVRGSAGDARTDASLRAHAARMPALPAPPDGQGGALLVPLSLRSR